MGKDKGYRGIGISGYQEVLKWRGRGPSSFQNYAVVCASLRGTSPSTALRINSTILVCGGVD